VNFSPFDGGALICNYPSRLGHTTVARQSPSCAERKNASGHRVCYADGEGFLCNPCPSLPRPREAPRLPSRGFFIYPHLPAQTCGLRLAEAARERPGGGDKKSAEAKSVAPTQASSANNNNNSSNSIDTGKPDCCIAQSGARSAPAARASRDDRVDFFDCVVDFFDCVFGGT
jgi:hypothetical protein